MFVEIKKSNLKNKKWTAVFYDGDHKKVKTTHFGDNRYNDYTQHHDNMRKQAYIDRHQKNEDWTDYMSAGTLSKHLLWTHKDFNKALSEYLKTFNLKAL